jgi:glycosyltransferase involved in cell wall biosynthesis
VQPETRPTLSVVLITRDEEQKIRTCLESVKWADEIVVVDSLSTDRTVEIARDYTDRVHQRPFAGFGEQKGFALAQATGEWILSVDADEVVSEDLRGEIHERIADDESCGYHIPRKSYFFGRWIRHCGWWPDYVLRLFRRDSGAFSSRLVHEIVQVDGPTRRLTHPIEHHPYTSVEDIVRKQDLYTRLSAQAAMMAEDGGSPGRQRLPLAPVNRAVAKFLKTYFLKAGFLDGREGLILSAVASYYVFLKHMKIWEARRSGR